MGKWLDRVVDKKRSVDRKPSDPSGINTGKPGKIYNWPYRRLLQFEQAAQDYRRYGYIKIFSTVLGKAVYFAKDERAAQDVPDPSIPVFLESETEAVKDLAPEVVKLLLEARILFGGPIKIEDSAQPRQPLDGKGIAQSFYGKAGEL